MHEAFTVYGFIVTILWISSLVVAAECVATICTPGETAHNRRAALLWIPFMWAACALWPLLIGFGLWQWLAGND